MYSVLAKYVRNNHKCDRMNGCMLRNIQNKQKEWHPATKPLKNNSNINNNNHYWLLN